MFEFVILNIYACLEFRIWDLGFKPFKDLDNHMWLSIIVSVGYHLTLAASLRDFLYRFLKNSLLIGLILSMIRSPSR